MTTQGDYVSSVLNSIKALNKDMHISRRYILSRIKSKAKREISRKMDRRALYAEPGLFSWVKCFELEREDVVTCDIVEFRVFDKIMKSKLKLPELITHDYGSGIKMVTTLDSKKTIEYVDFAQLIRNHERQYKIKNKTYFTIIDNYLYLFGSEIEAVNILLASLNEEEIRVVSQCGDWDICTSAWDYNLPIPPKMSEYIIQEVISEILGSTLQIPEDENPNLDSNIKSQTTV